MNLPEEQPPDQALLPLSGLLEVVHETASGLVDAAVKESIESILSMLSLQGRAYGAEAAGGGGHQTSTQAAAPTAAAAADGRHVENISPSELLVYIQRMAKQVADDVVRAVVSGSIARVLQQPEIGADQLTPSAQPSKQATVAAPSAAARAAVDVPENVLVMGDTQDLAQAMVESYMRGMLLGSVASSTAAEGEGGGQAGQQQVADAATARKIETVPPAGGPGGQAVAEQVSGATASSYPSGRGSAQREEEGGAAGIPVQEDDNTWRSRVVVVATGGPTGGGVKAGRTARPPQPKRQPPSWALAPSQARHEPLRLRRIRHGLRLPRPAPPAVAYVPPRVVIRTRHPGHESRRVIRIRRAAKCLAELRKRRAAAAGRKAPAKGSRAASTGRPSKPHHASLVVRYLAHMLPIARDAGPEALLHQARLAAAADPPEPLYISPHQLLSTLTAEDPATRPTRVTVAQAAPAQELSVAAVDASGRRRGRRRKRPDEAASAADGAGRLASAAEAGEDSRRLSASSSVERLSSTRDDWSGEAGEGGGYVANLVEETPTDAVCPYRFRRLDEQPRTLSSDPVAFLFGLTHRYNTHGCTRLTLAAWHFADLSNDEDAGQLRAAITRAVAARTNALSSALSSLTLLAVAEDRQLLSIAARWSAYLTDDDRRRLSPCSTSLFALSLVLRRLQASAVRLQAKARQKHALQEAARKRREREAAMRIQTAFRGHMYGRLRVFRVALREARRRALGMDVDLMEMLVASGVRRSMAPTARMEVTSAVCGRLRSVADDGGAPSARALIGLGFLQDLADQLKDRGLPTPLTAVLIATLTSLTRGIPPTEPSPLLSRGYLVRTVLTLLSSTDAPDVAAACSFLAALSPSRCLAFPGAYLEAGTIEALTAVLQRPIEPLPHLLLDPQAFPSSLVHHIQQWASAAHALHSLHRHHHPSSPSRRPDPLPSLLIAYRSLLWLHDLCLTSAPLRQRYQAPQLHYLRGSCLTASHPLTALLLLLITSPHSPSRYAFSDSATDADLVLLLDRLMRLPHQPHAHDAALTIALHLCASGLPARRFLVRCSLIEPVQGLLDDYHDGRMRVAAEEVIRQLTQTILVEMEAEEEEGRLTAEGRLMIEQKAFRGLARALVE